MKNKLFFVAVTFSLFPIFAFSQEIEWQNTIGGSDADYLNSLQQTIDGGYILGGRSVSGISGDKTENCQGAEDFWIIKINALGSIQWQNTIGGNEIDVLNSIEQTSEGGYILGGHSRSNISGDKSENCQGQFDYWIVKTDASGNIQWQNTIGGNNNDYLRSIEQTSDGGYILGGYSRSNISGDKTENCNGIGWDYWIVKTDESGNIQWQNTIGGNNEDELHSIHQTLDGGYIIGGLSSSDLSVDKTENSNGLEDFWIIKTDSLGIVQWQNTIGGAGADLLQSTEQTIDGGYILSGSSNSNVSGDKSENCNGFTDEWIVKIDANGVIQWQNTIGGIYNDFPRCLQQNSDGSYILVGSSDSKISGDKTENGYGFSDHWLVKIDESGVIQWQNTIGGNNDDILTSLCQTNDGGYLVGGLSLSDISGDKTENTNGMYDYWIVKINDHSNLISGNLFIDANSNNNQESGENPVANRQVSEMNTNRFSFSEQNGKFNVSVLDSGIYSVAPVTLNYYNTVPTTHSASFTGLQQTDSLNDFAFQPAGVFNDLCVTVTPMGAFRAGFNASYLITYENVGTTTLNPTVIFFADNDVSFVSATPVANTVTLDSVVWNFGPLAPFQSGSILVTVNVTIGTPIGTVISSGAHIEPLAGDANTICNQSYWEVLTIGSLDPNDIIVDQDTLLTTQFPNPPFLEYIIRFQNTGNDTAFTVNILNPIDTSMLELSTIEFVAASHPVNLSWIPWEKNMQFKFDNILLPDCNINEPASHGFVRYRIKPKSSLVLGDSIFNNAAIYFDFNAPVITNTAITRVMLPTSLTENSAHFDNLLLYPNPANNSLTIETGNVQASECKLIISDVAGRMLYSKSIVATATKHRIDISSFSQGIYFVQLQTGENISRGRFVKE